jgi:hypothetical protein
MSLVTVTGPADATMIRDPQRPARLLRAEYDALLPILRRTTAEAFDSATACPRWSVRDVLAHCGAALSRGGNRPDARLHPPRPAARPSAATSSPSPPGSPAAAAATHIAPARGPAPRAGMDESLRSRLRARQVRRPDQPGPGTAGRMAPAATPTPAALGTRTSRRTSQRPGRHAPELTTSNTGRPPPGNDHLHLLGGSRLRRLRITAAEGAAMIRRWLMRQPWLGSG